jgi:hypothetical protein
MSIMLYFMGVMAEIGAFATSAMILWCLTNMDLWKILCISMATASFVTFPVMMKIEEWLDAEKKQ